MKPKPRHLGPEYGAQFQDAAVASVYRKRPPYPPELLDHILERVPRPSRARVLELGAGTGEIAIPLADRVARLDAVEVSGPMLAVAATQPGHERVHWHQQSAEAFAYPAIYDLIICAQCLAWFDWEVVFPRMVGSLDPDGWLLVIGQQALDDLPWMPDLTSIIASYSTNQDYEPFNLMEELSSRGLFDLRGKKSTWPISFSQTIDDYIDSIHARNGFSRDRMTPQSAADFDAEVRALLLTHHPDGTIRGRNQAIIQWGKPLLPRA